MTSAPASAIAATNFSVAAKEGSPAVMYATIPISPDSRNCAKRQAIRDGRWDSGGIPEFNRLTLSAHSAWLEQGFYKATTWAAEANVFDYDQDFSPRAREYVSMSLSPRPERLTITRSLAVND